MQNETITITSEPLTVVSLTAWERQKLSSFAASNALTYMQHNATGGLFDHEKAEMERWKALSDKLSGGS